MCDVTDWLVDGMGGETAKPVLDDFEWDGSVVTGITLQTSPDNKKIVGGNLFMAGELMKGFREIRANRLFPDVDKDFRISYQIEEASIFSFKSGSMIGELVDDDRIMWNVIKKTSRGNTELDINDYGTNNIGSFSVRPYVVPLSPTKARITVLVFPLHKADLEAQHAHWRKAAFPGLELLQCDVDLFPLVNTDTSKAWGCPFIPLLHLGGSFEDQPHLPPTDDIRAAISANLRTDVVPTTKRDLRTLAAAWTAVQESGPSKLKERLPDTLWPLWNKEKDVQRGEF